MANELAQLDPRIRKTLLINDYVIAFVDCLVTLAAIALEDDERPLTERLREAEFAVFDEPAEWVAQGLGQLDKKSIDHWGNRIKTVHYRKFLNRLVGTAEYDRLSDALQADMLIILGASRRVVGWLMPFAVALQDCLTELTEKQLAEVKFLDAAKVTLLGILLQLDELLGRIVADGLPLSLPEQNPFEADPSPAEVAQLTFELRTVIRSRAGELLQELDVFLGRKLRGARDAMEHSADGVSQAANSLIELIDRLARNAFDEDEVLAWVDVQFANPSEFTYSQNDSRRPTKRAQLLCLVYAGGPVDDPSVPALHRLVAFVLLTVRERLQKLKHADTGSDDELTLVRGMLSVVEGAFLVLVRLCWSVGDQAALQVIRDRITAER